MSSTAESTNTAPMMIHSNIEDGGRMKLSSDSAITPHSAMMAKEPMPERLRLVV